MAMCSRRADPEMDDRKYTRVRVGAAQGVGVSVGMVVNLHQEIRTRFDKSRVFDRAMFRCPYSYELYLRIGPRVFVDRIYRKALTLASVTVEQGARRRGVFTGMLREIESAAASLECDAVLVENIGNPIVQHVLERRRYRTNFDGGSLNMLLEVSE